jgi:hypothetical protein
MTSGLSMPVMRMVESLRVPRRAGVLILSACALALLAPSGMSARRPADRALPRVVLWAWERPVDLRALPAGTGVAFLAQTIVIDGSDRLVVVPRRQPLRVSPRAPLVAVTRIESGARAGGNPRRDLESSAVETIAATASLPQVAAIQVDFDAVVSERSFYARLLRHLRQALDREVPLSITGLVSWCAEDGWLDALPVDEVVPMLFSMGPAVPHQSRLLSIVRTGACRGAVGVSMEEPIGVPRDGRRVYVFSRQPWTEARVADAQRIAR